MENKYPFYIKFPLILLGIALTIAFLIVTKPLLVPILISVFIAILLMPLCVRLEKLKIPRSWAAAIVVIFSMCILAGLIILFIRQVTAFSQDAGLMEERLNELITQGKDFIAGITGTEPLPEITNIQDALHTVAIQNGGFLTSGAFSVLGKLIWLVLSPIFIFLMLIYRSFFKEFLVQAIAQKDKAKTVSVLAVVEHVKKLVQSYLIGVFIIMVVLAVCYYLILLAFGLNNAIFFAIFAGFLSIIPYVGLIVGAAFPAFYALVTKDSLIYPVGIFASFEIFVFIEGNLLKPYIVGHRVNMNPFTTILAILFGDMIWGVAGMILIIPTLAIIKEIFEQVDSLKPYAFLIGNVATEKNKKPGFIKKLETKIAKKSPANK